MIHSCNSCPSIMAFKWEMKETQTRGILPEKSKLTWKDSPLMFLVCMTWWCWGHFFESRVSHFSSSFLLWREQRFTCFCSWITHRLLSLYSSWLFCFKILLDKKAVKEIMFSRERTWILLLLRFVFLFERDPSLVFFRTNFPSGCSFVSPWKVVIVVQKMKNESR
jgi:hypothetical protein